MNKALEKILERLAELIEKSYYSAIDGNRNAGIKNSAYHKVYKIVQEVAEEFATDTNVGTNGWIACSDRLPEEEADVLLSLRSLDVYTGFRANAEGCFYIDGDGYVEYENVMAWMPLPEPYKESE